MARIRSRWRKKSGSLSITRASGRRAARALSASSSCSTLPRNWNRWSVDPRRFWNGELRKLQILASQLRPNEREPGHVAAWPGETRSESRPDRIANADEYDRHGRRCVPRSHSRRRAEGHDHRWLDLRQFPGQRGKTIAISVREPLLEHEVLTVSVSEVPESLPEGVKHRRCRTRRAGIERQDYDSVWLSRRLRLCGERRGEEATRQATDERPPVHHSIT